MYLHTQTIVNCEAKKKGLAVSYPNTVKEKPLEKVNQHLPEFSGPLPTATSSMAALGQFPDDCTLASM